jgi:hypothetical protein
MSQAEHQIYQQQIANQKQELKTVEENLSTNSQINELANKALGRVHEKIAEENDRKEDLEVMVYENTVKSATFSEDSDNLLIFMEEFIKKYMGHKTPRDKQAFNQMCPEEQENINEILKNLKIQY